MKNQEKQAIFPMAVVRHSPEMATAATVALDKVFIVIIQRMGALGGRERIVLDAKNKNQKCTTFCALR